MNSSLTIFLPLLIIMGAFMFFASRRQKKAMQATISLHDSLAPGDEIMTTAGLFGTITDVTDQKVDVELAPGVVVTMLKLAVKERVSADDDLDEDYEDDDDDYEDDDFVVTLEEPATQAVDQPSTATEVKAEPNRLTKD